jgi:Fasciclin domain
VGSVVLPPSMTNSVLDFIQGNSNWTKLETILDAVQLADKLRILKPLTFFAPPDSAFDETLSTLEVARILENHIFEDILYASELLQKDGEVIMSINGKEWVVEVLDESIFLKGSANDANIVAMVQRPYDVLARNGVLHSIDGLLLEDTFISNAPTISPTAAPTNSTDSSSASPTNGTQATVAPSLGSPTMTPSENVTIPTVPDTTYSPTSSSTTGMPTSEASNETTSPTAETTPASMPSISPTTTPSIVTVNTTFLMYNTEGLTSEEISLPENVFTINLAFKNFVTDLVSDVEGNRTVSNQRRLKMVQNPRQLAAALGPDATAIYGVRDVACPSFIEAPSIPQNASCHKIFGKYELLVTDEDPLVVHQIYVEETELALKEGKMQEQLLVSDPDFPFIVFGPPLPETPSPTLPPTTELPTMQTILPTNETTTSLVPSLSPTSTPDIVIVNTSFLLYSTEGLTSEEIQLPDNVVTLNLAFREFVEELVSDVESNRSVTSRRWLRTTQNLRLLAATVESETTAIYGVRDVPCPTDQSPPIPNNANCLIILGKYELLVTGEDPIVVYQLYVEKTNQAVKEGKMQEKLLVSDPDFPFIVFGPTPTESPVPTQPPKEQEKEKMEWWLIFITVLACILALCCIGFAFAYHSLRRTRAEEEELALTKTVDEESALILPLPPGPCTIIPEEHFEAEETSSDDEDFDDDDDYGEEENENATHHHWSASGPSEEAETSADLEADRASEGDESSLEPSWEDEDDAPFQEPAYYPMPQTVVHDPSEDEFEDEKEDGDSIASDDGITSAPLAETVVSSSCDESTGVGKETPSNYSDSIPASVTTVATSRDSTEDDPFFSRYGDAPTGPTGDDPSVSGYGVDPSVGCPYAEDPSVASMPPFPGAFQEDPSVAYPNLEDPSVGSLPGTYPDDPSVSYPNRQEPSVVFTRPMKDDPSIGQNGEDPSVAGPRVDEEPSVLDGISLPELVSEHADENSMQLDSEAETDSVHEHHSTSLGRIPEDAIPDPQLDGIDLAQEPMVRKLLQRNSSWRSQFSAASSGVYNSNSMGTLSIEDRIGWESGVSDDDDTLSDLAGEDWVDDVVGGGTNFAKKRDPS